MSNGEIPATTLNIPQLLLVLVLGFLAVRWYLSGPPSSASSSRSSSRTPRIDYARVDQVAQMFPQADRRAIIWDMQRNGGNVAATTERILSRGLDVPPPSFQPPLPPQATPSGGAGARANAKTPAHPDLITRYNLSSKITPTGSSPLVDSGSDTSTPASTPSKPSWSTNKTERALQLQRRREEMILEARRKLEEKERAKTAVDKGKGKA
ncbi:hypothetical protein EJ05DRAFT_481976 [Pseudovirgaria hyperparasitica]|uniref:Coupling of ubiquitin conjugation to ER degradation protein 1 n=1 Tax=Pseudovirgaria hyperparasitica TaxID=470096 RepID=A0A6A6WM94_9PEZI|nr:uncharacterized protein EJ05DRAFT_481976 [Pseudovirgaria hyperparasitica]KAF2763139.1 hypothetical protein EJ05DRAFT_481976 [Pseudovirgaria hyperparasitica]